MKNLSVIIFLIIFLFYFLAFIFFVQAANPLDVVINEIAWMGTENSYNDEWIELYNNTDFQINLSGWRLSAQDGSPKINLSGIIPPNGFYLLERTNDETIPDIEASQIYTGAMGNAGENLELYDGSGNLIDQVNCSSAWFSGDNFTKQTMERKNSLIQGSDSGNWQTSQNPNGTPKAKNSEQKTTNKEKEQEKEIISQPEKTKEKPTETEVSLIINYPDGIIFNEILPSPAGPDNKEEWIEIFNQNNFEVDLSNWKIEDMVGKIQSYNFPSGTKISELGFLVLSSSTTKITLNNDGDGLNLIRPDGKITDSVNYQKAVREQSYSRIDSKWVWNIILTPGSKNVVSEKKLEEKESQKDEKNLEISKEEISEETKKDFSKKQLAAVGKQIPESSGFLSIFLIALGIALSSGIIILTLKRKIKKSGY